MDKDTKSRLRVHQVGAVPLWSTGGDSIHTRELARSLSNEGIEPVVLGVPGPLPPDGANLNYKQAAVVPYRFMRQLSWTLSGSWAAIIINWQAKIDVVYSRMEPGIFTGFFASRMCRVPLVVELNGLPSEDVRLYRPSNSALLRVTMWWESFMYNHASGIVGAPGYIQYIQDHYGIDENKCRVAPLGVNHEMFIPMDRLKCLNSLDRKSVV